MTKNKPKIFKQDGWWVCIAHLADKIILGSGMFPDVAYRNCVKQYSKTE